jgi:hypothetical protein
VAGRVNEFVKKYRTIAIHHEVYDAHPRRTRTRVTHKSNTMSRPLLEFLKVLLDFLLIGVQIGDRDPLTYKKCTSNT